MRPHATVAAAVAAVAVATTVVSAAGGSATLRLDGVLFRPELALTSGQHQRGLMFRKKAPADGMLFVFPRATSGGFWMKNTLVPLTIVFFDTVGKRVRKLSMTPCRKDPCRIYEPGRPYRFALELRAGDPRRALRLGPPVELEHLVRLAG